MFSMPFTVRHSHLGANGTMRPAALLAVLQDLATADADTTMDMSRETLLSRWHALWIVSRTSLYIDRPMGLGDYTLTTWHPAVRAALWPRVYAVTDAAGETVVRCMTQWRALSDTLPRRIVALPAVPGDEVPMVLPPVVRPRMPDTLRDVGIHTVTLSDLDENRHVNNALALDILEDAAALAAPEDACGRVLREAHIHYAGEAYLGDALQLSAVRDGGCFSLRTALDEKPVHEAELVYGGAEA